MRHRAALRTRSPAWARTHCRRASGRACLPAPGCSSWVGWMWTGTNGPDRYWSRMRKWSRSRHRGNRPGHVFQVVPPYPMPFSVMPFPVPPCVDPPLITGRDAAPAARPAPSLNEIAVRLTKLFERRRVRCDAHAYSLCRAAKFPAAGMLVAVAPLTSINSNDARCEPWHDGWNGLSMSDGAPSRLAAFARVCTTDIDEAADEIGRIFCPHGLAPTGRGDPRFHAHHNSADLGGFPSTMSPMAAR